MSYKLLRKIIMAFLIFYFSVGLFARYLSDGVEDVYPFFSWFLFSKVPARIQIDFAIRIHEFAEKRFEPPIFFEKAKGIYDKTSYSTTDYYHLVQLLGMSLQSNRMNEVKRLRRELEKNFLSYPVVYEVVELKFNPIERWKTGQFIGIKSLVTFTSQAPVL